MAGALVALCSACVSFPDAPPETATPTLAGNVAQSADGALLGLTRWPASDRKTVVIAVHGMNDYAGAFADAGPWWAENAGIETIAIDQRGFGRSPAFGRWVGAETLKADLRAVVDAARAEYPKTPLFVLGHSMGAAVVMAAEADAPLGVDGLILAAPGVWGGPALPVTHRIAANLSAMIAPGKTLTGARAGRQATDNIEALREMARDPYVIKETRVDAVLGVVRLMGEAQEKADEVCAETLILVGDRDEIIPRKAVDRAADRLCGDRTVLQYKEGWHLLLRDKQAETVWRDIARWIEGEIEGE